MDHDTYPCSLDCWAAQKPWRVEEAAEVALTALADLDQVIQWIDAHYPKALHELPTALYGKLARAGRVARRLSGPGTEEPA